MHLARVMGNSGHLITAEPRNDHAEIGLMNLERASKCFPEFPKHTHLEGMIEDLVPDVEIDAVILDMPVQTCDFSTCKKHENRCQNCLLCSNYCAVRKLLGFM